MVDTPSRPEPDRRRRDEAAAASVPLDERMARVTVPRELDDPARRQAWRLEEMPHGRGPYLVELNIAHEGGLSAAVARFVPMLAAVLKRLCEADGVPSPESPVRIGKSYFRCHLRVAEWRALVEEDERQSATRRRARGDPTSRRCIYRLWPDFPVSGQISQSVATIKADAALRSFEATGGEITWAVIDSGIDGSHPHFGPAGKRKATAHALMHPAVADLHRCFAPITDTSGGTRRWQPPLADPDLAPETIVGRAALIEQHRRHALTDEFGHGTHVAGIIAGRAPEAPQAVVVLQREDLLRAGQGDGGDDEATGRVRVTRERKVDKREAARLHGVAPDCRLISLRVLDHEGQGRSSDVIRALEYVRETLNDNPKLYRVHGVNLSVGYEFDAEMYACGQSPLCAEVNRLVQAGVVVVTAAGNTGYGRIAAQARDGARAGLSNTINDPGNAEFAITVGATHRDSPHTYGVSYFSSKGPTGDGRFKPDLVAPGERIVSCAAGANLAAAERSLAGAARRSATSRRAACYVEDSGTSMAAPHVSGAIAAFLSIRKEFIGRPLEVKRIFMQGAVSLGRERYFEGSGMVDLMRAIQSV